MAATEHAGRLQVSRGDVIANYHCLWLLARLWYRLKRPIWRSEAVTVRTWPRTVIGASIYRDFALYVGQEPGCDEQNGCNTDQADGGPAPR